MNALAIAAGVGLVVLILRDAFETVILPRTVVRLFSLSRVINRVVWPRWMAIASHARFESRRERYLSFYGPTSVILMLAVWAGALVFGFALIAYGFGSPWQTNHQVVTFLDDVYVSGTTMFTLGLGDVVPTSTAARVMIVIEAGTGLGFLTVGIAYLPVVYQSFSRREAQISRLDAWAGSPPAAAEIFKRLAASDATQEIHRFLHEWERWCSHVLESHISYPQLSYFRSQHGRQSWVSSITTVLDTSAVILCGIEGVNTWQARLTFAIARHTVVDLGKVLPAPPVHSSRHAAVPDQQIIEAVEAAGCRFSNRAGAAPQLAELRAMYEPFVEGLAVSLDMELPPWVHDDRVRDNWEKGRT